jgi:DNA-binding NarL/FixJ family response regulator
MAIRVLLVDDNALFRDGVARILKSDGRFEVVGQASTGDEAVAIAAELKPDLVLLDLRMPGAAAPETIGALLAQRHDMPIGILTVFESDEFVQPALKAGARGYVAKDSTARELCEAAVALVHGRAAHLVPRKGARSQRATVDSLTARELEVLRALASGASYATIARDLGISPKTLRNHISNTYHKLEIYDRAQAVIAAVQAGVVDVPAAQSPQVPSED